MEILDAAQAWIQKLDPVIRWLVGLGVPGGLAYLWKQYASRARVEIRDFKFSSNHHGIVRSVSFNAVNTSDKLTAFRPTFGMTGITPEGHRQTYTFTFFAIPLQQLDLRLPPHEVRQFVATHEDLQNRIVIFLWYMQFSMPLTRGYTVHFRIKNAERRELSTLRFHVERMCFRIVYTLARWRRKPTAR